MRTVEEVGGVLTPKIAMKILGISKPTFIRYVKIGLIKRVNLTGENSRYFVTNNEIERVKKLLAKNWTLGRSKVAESNG